jgi:hypothetical protein
VFSDLASLRAYFSFAAFAAYSVPKIFPMACAMGFILPPLGG